jgi:peroxiredoxin
MKDLIAVGATAPGWTLSGSDGHTHTLQDVLQRELALLVFYPGNNTPG